MQNRRTLLATLPFATLAFAGIAQAMGAMPFDPAAFEAAKKSGKPVLVEVTAPWCPVCKAQRPILSELGGQPRFKDMAVFDVDFDTRKDVLRTLGVQKQSTLIVYREGKEVGRSTGETGRAAIEELLAKAI